MDRLFGEPLTDAERAVMFAEARKLLGVPWRHKGRTERGVDCLNYVWMVLYRTTLAARGVTLPNPPDDYGRTPHNRKLRDGLIQWLGPPITGLPQPGDVVTMQIGAGEEHHVGIVVPHPFYGIGLIHADNKATGGHRVVEHGIDYVWLRRIVEGFRP